MLKTKIKYMLHDPNCKIEQHGNWCDLRVAKEISMAPYEFKILPLGLSVKLPKYYEMNIVPRSGTFKNFGVLQANDFGIIDTEFSGMKDIVGFPAKALDLQVNIPQYSRICQFRINLSMDAPWYVRLKWIFSKYVFEEVSVLHGPNRGGYGSTGTK